jgi:hypothetical protein
MLRTIVTARRVGLFGVATVLIMLSAAGGGFGAAQETSTLLAAPFPGEIAFRFFGEVDADGADQPVGYLGAVAGLDADLLSTDPTSLSVETARFVVTSSAAEGDDGATSITIGFIPDGGASFDDPASFATGTVVATFTSRTIEPLIVDGGDEVIVVGALELTQISAETFELDGDSYRFGVPDLRLQLRLTGSGTGDASSSVVYLSATATVLGGDSATPIASPEADCGGAAGWVAQSNQRLTQASAIAASIPAQLAALQADAPSLRALADELAGMFASQRTAAAPGAAESADRLLVTVLSTYSRGVELALVAAEAGDDTSLQQARRILADGDALATLAANAIDEVARACGIAP